jgi:hypothetical protein
MRLTGRFALATATIAAFVMLAAAQASRAQNSPPPAQPAAPASSTAAAGASQPPAVNSHGPHTVTLTFDYDFRVTRACSKKITQNCVQRFVAYDISAGAGHASMLFPIPLPAKPVGLVHGIVATSPKLDFESGQHLISVIAQGPDGKQSRKSVCTTWITIP